MSLIIAKIVNTSGRLWSSGRAAIVRFAAVGLLLSQIAAVSAFETDQYNLPPVPLADIGPEVAEYTEENIRIAITKINNEILAKERCLNESVDKPKNCGSAASVRARLAYLRSELAVARGIYDRLGYGIIAFARAGTWMDRHRFRAQPARYKTSYGGSIFVYLPSDYFTISPTVNMYGVNLGTDKIAHFFQQGYTYYRISGRAIAKGSSTEEAEKQAVEWGKMTERTYYGTLVGGVFSNADLFANYVGMRFYQGLTRPVTINGRARSATLKLKDGIWVFNEREAPVDALIRPFISEHMNEALNPSVFIPGLRSSIRSIVRKRSCPQWKAAHPGRTKEDYETLTDSLTLWNGEDYGFKPSEKFVTIANTCFADDAQKLKDSIR